MSNNVLEYLTEDDVVVVLNTGDLAYFEKRVYVAREQRRKKLQAEAMKAGFEFVEDSSRKGADAMITTKELKEQFNAGIFEIFMIFAFVLLLIIVSVCSSVFLST
ncbi:hypothetical protein CAEBREN_09456 [Caenorhabditis brenneri]|uniref:Uncharacterized protein n=1 Tax=Caenorhabditis brenneri TaxID=135651 RepID=G0MMV3_CAEBE|nr:hypothetical protein CAEBREN_09456 [Caenorhabditis brenneri]